MYVYFCWRILLSFSNVVCIEKDKDENLYNWEEMFLGDIIVILSLLIFFIK